ncbi:hypothetical protein TELCIR_23083, partial [Teladorsagia circumcincta]
GLEYLHSSQIGFHGSLTPWACLIDRNWTIKLTDFGIADSLERWEKQGLIATETLKEGEDEWKSGSLQKTKWDRNQRRSAISSGKARQFTAALSIMLQSKFGQRRPVIL